MNIYIFFLRIKNREEKKRSKRQTKVERATNIYTCYMVLLSTFSAAFFLIFFFLLFVWLIGELRSKRSGARKMGWHEIMIKGVELNWCWFCFISLRAFIIILMRAFNKIYIYSCFYFSHFIRCTTLVSFFSFFDLTRLQLDSKRRGKKNCWIKNVVKCLIRRICEKISLFD